MSTLPKLTQAEEEIMQHIWQLGRCTVSQVIESMGDPDTPHSSVSTIVRILERKGFLDHKAYGRTYEYFPLVSREDYSRRSLRNIIRSYFDGSPTELVSFLVQKDETSVEELQALIRELKKKQSS